ncbi:transcription elongation factor GreA [Anaerovoracaceae bacterium 41-7]|jgi:transcription elongation factor GreA|uniref:Transcription elongation factor GreA n=1 Tax=Anaerotruncus colihominis TaxID=169435 RepID=A0A845QIX4_9FIRM|nr:MULTISPECIES: transcription elongation factor GreA [Clostridia]MCI9477161.1 transcription elongation factor GreA [Emergencia sp.]MCI9641044.1 transcription elongation factor GreA [Emergencia sp.]NBH61526.1 transcription elongation factor GreA [Anaerotruncus colihominis]NCF00005.1 transcription elongation factor GreA [Emergencia sp. 1XD21-10]NCF02181.1 transcription elongation factor GreA [Anaerotruncus sp. 80]
MSEEILLTQEGYDKLEAERDMLVSVRRKEVSERLKEAISYGDLSENAEYDAAKNEQAELEERIHKLETMMRNAKIINEDEVSGDHVNVGLTVRVVETQTGEEQSFVIVGSTEADPFAEPARISNESLVGQGLLGKGIGEVAEIVVPDGVLHYRIEEITK